MLKYTRTHEWVKLENGVAKVGITEHAQKELGDIVYIELPKVGHQVKEGDTTAVLESTKAAADFYSPVSGTITEVNEKLKEDSGLINQSAEKEGWIYKIHLTNPEELKRLLELDDYLSLVS